MRWVGWLRWYTGGGYRWDRGCVCPERSSQVRPPPAVPGNIGNLTGVSGPVTLTISWDAASPPNGVVTYQVGGHCTHCPCAAPTSGLCHGR